MPITLIPDLGRTFGQLSDRRFRRLVIGSCLLAAGLLAGLAAAAVAGITALTSTGIGWLDATLDWTGGAAALVVAILLFPAAAIAMQGVVLERVAETVERRHYPALGPPRAASWREAVLAPLAFAGWTALVNLLLLPVYLLTPPISVGIFWAVNGALIGREYFEAVAFRRLDHAEARALRRSRRIEVWLAGVVIAALLTMPGLNLAAPALGAALMLHRFERLRAGAAGA